MSPSSRVIAASPAMCDDFSRKAAALRVRTVALMSAPSCRFACSSDSSSQWPKKPVPPVTKMRAPRSEVNASRVCARMSSRSLGGRGLAVMRFQYAPDHGGGEVAGGPMPGHLHCHGPLLSALQVGRRKVVAKRENDNVFIYSEGPPECH